MEQLKPFFKEKPLSDKEQMLNTLRKSNLKTKHVQLGYIISRLAILVAKEDKDNLVISED
jgi:hypothetical protein